MEHLGSQHRSNQNPRVHMPPYPIVDEDCGSGSVPSGIDTLVSPPLLQIVFGGGCRIVSDSEFLVGTRPRVGFGGLHPNRT